MWTVGGTVWKGGKYRSLVYKKLTLNNFRFEKKTERKTRNAFFHLFFSLSRRICAVQSKNSFNFSNEKTTMFQDLIWMVPKMKPSRLESFH